MSSVSIIMYHYVRDLHNSKYPAIKGLDIKAFVRQIKFLKKFYNLVSAEQVIHSIESGDTLPPHAALLTFDDGYIDHYTNVFPILDEYQIKGSFYIPAKTIVEHEVLDVNKIHFVLASVDDKAELIKDIQVLLIKYQQEYNLHTFEWYFSKLAIESRFDTKEVIFIKRLLQVGLEEELRGKITDELFSKYVSSSETMFAKELYMSEEQIKHMRSAGMHIGSHGYNHYWWNSLSYDGITKEIDLSLSFLTDIGADMNNWTACYPYGSYDTQAVDVLNQKGCKMALTTVVDVANTQNSMPLLMPRLDTNDLPIEENASPNKWYNIT